MINPTVGGPDKWTLGMLSILSEGKHRLPLQINHPQNSRTGNPLTAGVDRTLKPSRMESVQRSRSISLFRWAMTSLTASIRLVFFTSTILQSNHISSSRFHRLWRETRMLVVMMMMVMVVVMGMNNHHDLRLRRYRNRREAEDENQSEQ